MIYACLEKDLPKAVPATEKGTLLISVCPRVKKSMKLGWGWLDYSSALGPIPLDPKCYDKKGYIDYKKYKNSQTAKFGTKELVSFHKNFGSVLLVCSCPDVRNCHITNFIAPGIHSHGLIPKVFAEGKFGPYTQHLKGPARKFKGKHGYYQRRWIPKWIMR